MWQIGENILPEPIWRENFCILFLKQRILVYFIFLSDGVAPQTSHGLGLFTPHFPPLDGPTSD